MNAYKQGFANISELPDGYSVFDAQNKFIVEVYESDSDIINLGEFGNTSALQLVDRFLIDRQGLVVKRTDLNTFYPDENTQYSIALSDKLTYEYIKGIFDTYAEQP